MPQGKLDLSVITAISLTVENCLSDKLNFVPSDSSAIMWFAFGILAIVLLALHVKKYRQPKMFPPGPRFPFPLIGDGYLMGTDLTRGFFNLREKYGDIVGMFLGTQRTVVLFNADTIIEAMAKDEISGRGGFAEDMLERVQGAPGR